MSSTLAIDFGTSFIHAFAIVENRPVPVLNSNSKSEFPSSVFLQNDGRFSISNLRDQDFYIGDMNFLPNIPELLGLTFNSAKHFCAHHSITCVIHKDRFARPVFEFESAGGKAEETAENLAALLIGNIKSQAEIQIGSKFQSVIVTIPSECNKFRHQETYRAAKKAGFQHVILIPKSTITVIADDLQTDNSEERASHNGTVFIEVTEFDCEVTILLPCGKISCYSADLGHHHMTSKLAEYSASLLITTFEIGIQCSSIEHARLRAHCSAVSANRLSFKMELENRSLEFGLIQKFYEDNFAGPFVYRIVEFVKNCLWKTRNQVGEDVSPSLQFVLLGKASESTCLERQLRWAFGRDASVKHMDDKMTTAALTVVASVYQSAIAENGEVELETEELIEKCRKSSLVQVETVFWEKAPSNEMGSYWKLDEPMPLCGSACDAHSSQIMNPFCPKRDLSENGQSRRSLSAVETVIIQTCPERPADAHFKDVTHWVIPDVCDTRGTGLNGDRERKRKGWVGLRWHASF